MKEIWLRALRFSSAASQRLGCWTRQRRLWTAFGAAPTGYGTRDVLGLHGHCCSRLALVGSNASRQAGRQGNQCRLGSTSTTRASPEHEREQLLIQERRARLTRRLSQATGHTHPHLMSVDQVTPGIPLVEYLARRSALAELMPPHSLLILPAATEQYYSMDVPHRFRQHTDFLYFTGCMEPNAALVVYNSSSSEDTTTSQTGAKHTSSPTKRTTFLLFMRPRDAARELWDGPMIGLEDASAMFGIADVRPIDSIGRVVAELVHAGSGTAPMLFFDARVNPEIAQRLCNALAPSKAIESLPAAWHAFISQLHSPVPLVQPLRLFKSSNELSLMRRAAAVTTDAFLDAMQMTQPGLGEWQVAARIAYTMHSRGGPNARLAFPIVAASGPRACTLHYIDNAALLQNRQLIMVDAGVELHGYCSDVSRTWPTDGRFDDAAKTLYEWLLSIHRTCVDMARESKPSAATSDQPNRNAEESKSLEYLQRVSVRLIAEGLFEFGFFQRKYTVEEIIQRGLYTRYFPHALGHYLGMDTHDTHQLSKSIPFQAGMVITVEPGIYVPAEDPDAPAAFHGLGIRIEDDVVIRASGAEAEVLSSSIPLQVADIEAIARERHPTRTHEERPSVGRVSRSPA